MTTSYDFRSRAASHDAILGANFDMKKAVAKLVQTAVKDLKKFADAQPEGIKVHVGSSLESPPPRGGYGPYEVGEIWCGEHRARIVGDLSDSSIGVAVYHGPHLLQGHSGRGPAREATARLKKVVAWFKEQTAKEVGETLKARAPQQNAESTRVWSVVQLGTDHGYATDVQTFSSQSEAERHAKDVGNVYVVEGTQMWNEPLGQVEEHDRRAKTRFYP